MTRHTPLGLIAAGLAVIAGIACAVVINSQDTDVQASIPPFNPENIISDANFTDYKSMSAAEIQNFLNRKNSVCLRNFQTLSLHDSNRDGLGDEPYGKGANHKVSAATLIWQAAQIYKINPRVILVTLEKEQGLVTGSNCATWKYNTALGYGCPDNEPCDSTAYGLTRQIDYGVWHFRGFFDDSYPIPPTVPDTKTIAYNPDGRCGGKKITIRNRATAALYSYTPYQPNSYALSGGSVSGYPQCGAFGNRNFYNFYTNWFGPARSSSDALFVVCGDGNKYLIESTENRKRLMTDRAVAAWGLTDADFLDIDYGCAYPAYDLPMDDTVRIRSSGNVYLVDNNNAYHASQTTGRAWGLGSNISSATFPQVNPDTLLDNLNKRTSLPRVAKSTNSGVLTTYLIDGGKRYALKDSGSGDTSSQRLVTGDTKNPRHIFSVGLLQTLPLDSTPLDYSFTVGSNRYVFDFHSIRQVSSDARTAWANINTGTAPALTSDALSMLPRSTIGNTFARSGAYYSLQPNTTYNQTTSGTIANSWGGPHPGVTQLLTNKVKTNASLGQLQTYPSGNVRTISCDGQKYIVERFRRVKRLISDETAAHWQLDSYYWIPSDHGCSYPSYTEPLDDYLIRSRNTKKVYYVHQGVAYYVDSATAQSRGFGDITRGVYPQFDPPSILDNLTVSYSPLP